jgi:beta-glucosidase
MTIDPKNSSLPNWQELPLKVKIAQIIVVRASGYLFDEQIRYSAWEPIATKLQHYITDLQVGGIILLGASAAEIYLRTQQLQNWATIPLLIGADVEEGVGQRFEGATCFPPPMALGAIYRNNLELALDYARQMGAVTASEALAIGINWLYAPIVDVNNNPDNPVINIRAFSDNPEAVSQIAAAFIQGAQSSPILTTAKHFPGHGDTATDSHLQLPSITHDLARLEALELLPFAKAIASGVDSIMTAHLLVPALDAERPATLSHNILTGQLRQKMGFEGLIVTDALIMGGVSNYNSPEEVAVMAIEAGADVLLMPPDPEAAIEAIYQAVITGRLTEERIDRSIARIWQAKQKVFSSSVINTENFVSTLNKGLRGDLPSLFTIAQPEAKTTVAAIIRDSLKYGGKLPLTTSQTEKQRNLIVVDDLLKSDFLGLHTPAITLPKQLGYEIQIVDRNSLQNADKDPRPTLMQVFLRANPFRGSAGLSPEAEAFYRRLLQTDSLQGLIVYGSPYILDWFLPKLPNDLPWVFTYGQIPIAQAIVCKQMLSLSKNHDSINREFL